jgi:hypothetical protein
VPYGNVDRVSVQFTEHVNVDEADLSVAGVTHAAYTVDDFAYDPYTYTATWTLSAPLPLDHVELTLDGDAGGVADAQGELLDGEWANGEDLFPSGNGAAGGDFRFWIRVAPGDTNRDGTVNGADFAILAANFGKVNRLPAEGDFTGDGAVDGSDFAILAANFGRTTPPAPASAPAPALGGPVNLSTASTARRQPRRVRRADRAGAMAIRGPHGRPYGRAALVAGSRRPLYAKWLSQA